MVEKETEGSNNDKRKTLIVTQCGKNKLRGTAAARHVSSLNSKPLESDGC